MRVVVRTDVMERRCCWDLDTANESNDAADEVAGATLAAFLMHDGRWLAWQRPELWIRWIGRQAAGRQGH